jgi:hypothetical protein
VKYCADVITRTFLSFFFGFAPVRQALCFLSLPPFEYTYIHTQGNAFVENIGLHNLIRREENKSKNMVQLFIVLNENVHLCIKKNAINNRQCGCQTEHAGVTRETFGRAVCLKSLNQHPLTQSAANCRTIE